uniref:Candidate secreted effector n=1 Tax=Meloidogyne incognita TaxID=6306 RepID=A0A914NDD3_MELIC
MHYITVLIQHNFTTKNYQNLRELLKLKRIMIFNVVFVFIILKKDNLHNQLLVNIFFTLIVFGLGIKITIIVHFVVKHFLLNSLNF